MQTYRGLTVDSPATYRLRIQGYLAESWSEYMGGVIIQIQSQPHEPPTTLITGYFQDQAALATALNLLYDLGLPLLSVECIGLEPNKLP